jgi:hypothetical protein
MIFANKVWTERNQGKYSRNADVGENQTVCLRNTILRQYVRHGTHATCHVMHRPAQFSARNRSSSISLYHFPLRHFPVRAQSIWHESLSHTDLNESGSPFWSSSILGSRKFVVWGLQTRYDKYLGETSLWSCCVYSAFMLTNALRALEHLYLSCVHVSKRIEGS